VKIHGISGMAGDTWPSKKFCMWSGNWD
jgi:hypothetical protein